MEGKKTVTGSKTGGDARARGEVASWRRGVVLLLGASGLGAGRGALRSTFPVSGGKLNLQAPSPSRGV